MNSDVRSVSKLIISLLVTRKQKSHFSEKYLKFLEQFVLKYVIILIKEKVQDFTRGLKDARENEISR